MVVKRVQILILMAALTMFVVVGLADNMATEAPAGFETPTLVQNPGSESHSNGIGEPEGDTFAADQGVFEEQNDVSTGLGPVYNARACAECHQNPVTGGSSQFTEIRAGHLDQDGNFGRKILEIDYDTYAEGEAELGWLNASVRVTAAEPFDLDAFLLKVMAYLRGSLGRSGLEVAHLKAIGLSNLSFGVANLVSGASEPELSLPSHGRVPEAELVVNARVATDPAVLEELVRTAVEAVCRAHRAAPVIRSLQSFRPGRPQPTHRYAEAK